MSGCPVGSPAKIVPSKPDTSPFLECWNVLPRLLGSYIPRDFQNAGMLTKTPIMLPHSTGDLFLHFADTGCLHFAGQKRVVQVGMQGTAGFSPCFNLPGNPFGTGTLSESLKTKRTTASYPRACLESTGCVLMVVSFWYPFKNHKKMRVPTQQKDDFVQVTIKAGPTKLRFKTRT